MRMVDPDLSVSRSMLVLLSRAQGTLLATLTLSVNCYDDVLLAKSDELEMIAMIKKLMTQLLSADEASKGDDAAVINHFSLSAHGSFTSCVLPNTPLPLATTELSVL